MSEESPGITKKPAELLQRLITQRGWNPHRLASMTDGEVSATTIRNYLKGSTPAIENLKWVALQFGLEDGSSLLRAYGHEKTADWFERDLEIAESMRKDLLRRAKLLGTIPLT